LFKKGASEEDSTPSAHSPTLLLFYFKKSTRQCQDKTTAQKDYGTHLIDVALDFVVQDNGDVMIRPATEDIRRLKGLLHRPGRLPVSVGEMNQAIRNRRRKVQ